MNVISIWGLVKAILIAAGAVYVALALILTLFQTKLVYYPTHDISSTPRNMGMQYEDVDFNTADNVTINGWYIPKENRLGVLLFCHGNAGNISHRLESIEIFHNLGLAVFIFDYRGYGNSGGTPSEKGTYLDVEAAWRYLTETRNIDPSEIIIFGRSLGGSIAAYLAKEVHPEALILESSMTSVPDMAAKMYPFLPVRLLSRYKYSTIDYVQDITCPVLIIHSPQDEVIPFRNGQRLFDAAHEPKTFLEIKGSHNDGFIDSGAKYVDGIRDFIAGLSGRAD